MNERKMILEILENHEKLINMVRFDSGIKTVLKNDVKEIKQIMEYSKKYRKEKNNG